MSRPDPDSKGEGAKQTLQEPGSTLVWAVVNKGKKTNPISVGGVETLGFSCDKLFLAVKKNASLHLVYGGALSDFTKEATNCTSGSSITSVDSEIKITMFWV